MGSEHVVRRVRRCEDSGDARDVIAVLTLSQYRDDVDVQAECLRVLGNVCAHAIENGRLAGRSGAIQAVVDAMKHHGENEKVQEYGCGALHNMCSGNDENRRLAGRHGAIQAVVDAMKDHGENENVQRSGCAALMSMTRHGGNENVRKKGYGNFVASLLWWLASLLWWPRRTNKSPTRR